MVSVSDSVDPNLVKCEICKKYRHHLIMLVHRVVVLDDELNIIVARNINFCPDNDECPKCAAKIGNEFFDYFKNLKDGKNYRRALIAADDLNCHHVVPEFRGFRNFA